VARKLAAEASGLIDVPSMKIETTLGVLAAGRRKFVESYADLLGKGVAALTIRPPAEVGCRSGSEDIP
jgi:hypothetical protein